MKDDDLVDSIVADRYRVLRLLGEGAMSRVYEVQHTKLARAFAMKRLQPVLADNLEAIHRFSREAELLASLRHPNVVDISDWVTLADGTPCMILEFLHGASLYVRLQRGALSWGTIARMGDQAMSALQLAHRMGIIHRDLKPENIFISIDDVGDERVKIVDFGVSHVTGTTRLSGHNEIVGTPSYMAPEQAQGLADEIGPATDVWAMGAILYEMATQRVAFDAASAAEALVRILSGQPEPLLAHRKDAPPAFVELVERALARDARRIRTIEELRAGLQQALAAPAPAVARTATGRGVDTPVLSRTATGRVVDTPVLSRTTTGTTPVTETPVLSRTATGRGATPVAGIPRVAPADTPVLSRTATGRGTPDTPVLSRTATGRGATPVAGIPRVAPTDAPALARTATGRTPAAGTPNPFPAEGTAIDDRRRRQIAIGIIAALVVTALNVAIALAL